MNNPNPTDAMPATVEAPSLEPTIPVAGRAKAINPDAELRLDVVEDTLYDDGLQIGDHTLRLAGTHGDRPLGSIIKG